MFKKLAYGTGGFLLLALGAAFGYFAFYIARAVVIPAVRTGSLNVDTSSTILNITWEGNQIYIVIAGYLLLAGVSAYGAIRLFMAASGQKQAIPPAGSGR